MTDREKVKAELDAIIDECRGCDYVRFSVVAEHCTNILALLKEQEAVEPEVEVLNEIDRIYRCPKCHKCFFYEKQKYCDQCGQAVKWNDD